MMYALIVYANIKGIRSVDEIVELCERDKGTLKEFEPKIA